MNVTFQLSGKGVALSNEVLALTRSYESGMMDANELLNLAATLTATAWDEAAFVVEIGAYLGTTTVFMAKVLEAIGVRVPVLSIDPFERYEPNPCNPQGSYAAYVASVAASGVDDICLPLATFSENAAPVIANNIGVLVIDGDHEYAAVRKDLALFSSKVREGGYIFLDDYGPSYPGVVRAVDEFFSDNPSFLICARSYFVVAQRRWSAS
jgi:cephalosporin hydroxylase